MPGALPTVVAVDWIAPEFPTVTDPAAAPVPPDPPTLRLALPSIDAPPAAVNPPLPPPPPMDCAESTGVPPPDALSAPALFTVTALASLPAPPLPPTACVPDSPSVREAEMSDPPLPPPPPMDWATIAPD